MGFYVRYRRRCDPVWARSDGMTWTRARGIADELAKLGFLAEVRECTYAMLKAARAS